MKRCPECGRGGGKGIRLSAPALLTLAAEEVADGVDMEPETIEQLVLLRRMLRRAETKVDTLIEERANQMRDREYRTSKIRFLRKHLD